MNVNCKRCHRNLKLPEVVLGKILRCPNCGWKFSIEVCELTGPPITSSESRPPAVSPHPGSPLDQLASATAPSPFTQQHQQPARPRHAYRVPRRGTPKWILPLVLVGVAGVVLIVMVLIVTPKLGLLSQTGVAAGDTDIRKVIADPQAYAGQTLKSHVIMQAPNVFRGIGAVKSMPLMLMASPTLENKAMNILQSIGDHQAVMIKYRIHDRATFAKIKAYEKGQERAKAEEERIFDAGSDGATVDSKVVERVDKMREARQKAREREVGENDPADYSGVLLDIWIP